MARHWLTSVNVLLREAGEVEADEAASDEDDEHDEHDEDYVATDPFPALTRSERLHHERCPCHEVRQLLPNIWQAGFIWFQVCKFCLSKTIWLRVLMFLKDSYEAVHSKLYSLDCICGSNSSVSPRSRRGTSHGSNSHSSSSSSSSAEVGPTGPRTIRIPSFLLEDAGTGATTLVESFEFEWVPPEP